MPFDKFECFGKDDHGQQEPVQRVAPRKKASFVRRALLRLPPISPLPPRQAPSSQHMDESAPALLSLIAIS